MKNLKLFRKSYDRLCQFLSEKNLSLMMLIVFMITLIPICYLSFVNRATGDDYGNGIAVRAAWGASHSLVEVAKAVGRTVRQLYVSYQGTWFSVALFALQPEVFSDKAYVIVTFMMLFLWIGSTMLLFRQIMKKECGLGIWNCLLVTMICLVIEMQFIPSTAAALFWFVGCAHYMLPFAMCQIMAWCLIRFVKRYQIRYLVGISILATLLGGSNYQAALFALMILFYTAAGGWAVGKNKKIVWLTIPFVLEMTGLIVSIKAPGNQVRGGAEFGFSLIKIITVIGKCFLENLKLVMNCCITNPIILIGLAAVFLILMEGFKRSKPKVKLSHLIIVICAMICLSSAMQAPELYAGVEVSGGVGNMNFLVFLLGAVVSLGMLAGYLSDKLRFSQEAFHKYIVLPGFAIGLILIVVFRSNLRFSTSWISMEYIRSGQANDYKEQMDLQTAILTDELVEDAVIPFINDDQGPLMSMPATDNPDAWTNTIMKQFYGKKSVTAIPRDEWEALYEGR